MQRTTPTYEIRLSITHDGRCQWASVSTFYGRQLLGPVVVDVTVDAVPSEVLHDVLETLDIQQRIW